MTEYIYRYILEMRDGITYASLIMINRTTKEEQKLWTETYPDNRVYLRLTETRTQQDHMLHMEHVGSWREQPPTFALPFKHPKTVLESPEPDE